MTYQVSNPINFYTGGDTTSQALGKHIAEIARIYEILNSMSTGGATIVTSGDTVLKAGEIGFDRGTGALKIGDGATPWNALTGISVVEIVDALTSSDATKALSAAQGKVLKDLIDAIPVVEVVDNLTAGGTTKALSAEQGKALKALVDTLETPVPGPPGPRGIEWRGAWDGVTEYQKGDAVFHQGSSYIALQPSMGEHPTNTEFWDVLSAKGADGQGAGDMTRAVYDSDGDGKVSFAEQADSAGAVPWDGITGKPPSFGPEIIDVLDSDRTDAALSAAQGKVLKGLVEAVPQVEVVDDLTTGGTDKALSAEQGKTLKGFVDSKADVAHQHSILQVLELKTRLEQIEAQLQSLGRGGEMKSDVFFTSGTHDWMVPQNITEVYVTVVGGGGGGSKSHDSNTQGPGGGAGGIVFRKKVAIDPSLWGTNITITVGAGGQGKKTVLSSASPNQSGGTSSFGSFVSATGGAGGYWQNSYSVNGAPGVPARQAKKAERFVSSSGNLTANTYSITATFFNDFSGGESPFYGLSAGGITGMDVHSFGAGGNGFRISDAILDSNATHTYEYMHGSPGLVVVEY